MGERQEVGGRNRWLAINAQPLEKVKLAAV
jgi:hypothetical protein